MNASAKYAAKQRRLKHAANEVATRLRRLWMREGDSQTLDLDLRTIVCHVFNNEWHACLPSQDTNVLWLEALAYELGLLIDEDLSRIPR